MSDELSKSISHLIAEASDIYLDTSLKIMQLIAKPDVQRMDELQLAKELGFKVAVLIAKARRQMELKQLVVPKSVDSLLVALSDSFLILSSTTTVKELIIAPMVDPKVIHNYLGDEELISFLAKNS